MNADDVPEVQGRVQEGDRPSIVAIIKQAKVTSKGQVLTSAVASLDPDSAQVLVVSDATREDGLRLPTSPGTSAGRSRWSRSTGLARRRLHPPVRSMSSTQNPRSPAAPPHRRRAPPRPCPTRRTAVAGARGSPTTEDHLDDAAGRPPSSRPGAAAAAGRPHRRAPGAPGPSWLVVAVLGVVALALVAIAAVLGLGTWNVREVREQDQVDEATRSAPAPPSGPRPRSCPTTTSRSTPTRRPRSGT